MEPLTSATAFASVISLLGQFIAERRTSKKLDSDEFMSWLSNNRHDEIKQLLELNTNSTISIKALLSVNHEELISKLEALDNALAIYASGVSGFSDLAGNLRPNSKLSEQAISILKQLDVSGGSGLLESKLRGVTLHILDAPGKITIDDQRFIIDDLNTLVSYGLLLQDYNDNGENLYTFTRAASDIVSTLG